MVDVCSAPQFFISSRYFFAYTHLPYYLHIANEDVRFVIIFMNKDMHYIDIADSFCRYQETRASTHITSSHHAFVISCVFFLMISILSMKERHREGKNEI